jgi:hypothetical protein
MAKSSVEKMFGGIPGEEHITRLLLKKVRTEMAKLPEPKLQEYLFLLEKLASSIRTGEDFEKMMTEGPVEEMPA